MPYLCKDMNSLEANNIKLHENVIIADADFIDNVAFDLTVNFERMLGRKIPKADMAQWVINVGLDGGMKPGEQTTEVILIYNKVKPRLDNFLPADLTTELNNQAFNDNRFGEFIFTAYPTEEIVTKEDFFTDMARTICNHKDVKRVMLIPDTDNADTWDGLRRALKDIDEDKHVTVFAMQPLTGGNFRQEILGYSLTNALGVRGDEFKE